MDIYTLLDFKYKNYKRQIMDSKVIVNNIFEYNDVNIHSSFEFKDFQNKAFDLSRTFTPINIHSIKVGLRRLIISIE